MVGRSIPRGRRSDWHTRQDGFGTAWATAIDGAEPRVAGGIGEAHRTVDTRRGSACPLLSNWRGRRAGFQASHPGPMSHSSLRDADASKPIVSSPSAKAANATIAYVMVAPSHAAGRVRVGYLDDSLTNPMHEARHRRSGPLLCSSPLSHVSEEYRASKCTEPNAGGGV